MKKLSAYKKLKAENLKLKQDLLIVCTRPDSVEAAGIKITQAMKSSLENTIWFGTTGNLKGSFNGVFKLIN